MFNAPASRALLYPRLGFVSRLRAQRTAFYSNFPISDLNAPKSLDLSRSKVITCTNGLFQDIYRLIQPTNSPSVSSGILFLSPSIVLDSLKSIFSFAPAKAGMADIDIYCRHFFNAALVLALLHLDPDCRRTFLKKHTDLLESVNLANRGHGGDSRQKENSLVPADLNHLNSYQLICDILNSNLKETLVNAVSCGLFAASDAPITMFSTPILFWILFGLIKFGGAPFHKYATQRLCNNFTHESSFLESSSMTFIPDLWDFLVHNQKAAIPNDLLLEFFTFLSSFQNKDVYVNSGILPLATIVQSNYDCISFFRKRELSSFDVSILALEQLVRFENWDSIPAFIGRIKSFYDIAPNTYVRRSVSTEHKVCECLFLSFPKQYPKSKPTVLNIIESRRDILTLYCSMMTIATLPPLIRFLLCERYDLLVFKQLVERIASAKIPGCMEEDFNPWLEWVLLSSVSENFPPGSIIRKTAFLNHFHKLLAHSLFMATNTNALDTKLPLLPSYLASIGPWISLASKGLLDRLKVSDVLNAIPAILFDHSASPEHGSTKVILYSHASVQSNREMLFLMSVVIAILDSHDFRRASQHLSLLVNRISPDPKSVHLHCSPLHEILSACDVSLATLVCIIETGRLTGFKDVAPDGCIKIPFSFLCLDHLYCSILNHLSCNQKWLKVVSIFRCLMSIYCHSEISSLLACGGLRSNLLAAFVASNSFDLIEYLFTFTTLDDVWKIFPRSLFKSLKAKIDFSSFLSDDIVVTKHLTIKSPAYASTDHNALLDAIRNIKSDGPIMIYNVRNKVLQDHRISPYLRRRLEIPPVWREVRNQFLHKFTRPDFKNQIDDLFI
ncbi:hypothetical protein MDAP_001500 [Mitosporidium daphniae]|uniref:Uncharacterized protein n=1 Tax=Mitosporidium daphniae TaxID=1485682 RepID=A0A098VM49_9MICR|nr:uncharacterized protein DI09_83p100 [Mitosporidium daphniae]KGG50177.1 hypothetical protein DI09_83p100 [Mitosporidium daphniae]|eukprot:XP_013236604.1 uncharacterized protein DI09_83p100 [Mitosporidium daphniae]